MLVDLVAGAYVVYGTVRGRKRGLADESFRLVRFAVALAAGCGLYGLISQGAERLLSLAGDISAPVVFAGTVGGSWWLLRALKHRFKAWVGARFMPYARAGGAVAGGLRTALVVLGAVGVLTLAGRVPGSDSVRQDSVVGRVAAWIVRAD